MNKVLKISDIYNDTKDMDKTLKIFRARLKGKTVKIKVVKENEFNDLYTILKEKNITYKEMQQLTNVLGVLTNELIPLLRKSLNEYVKIEKDLNAFIAYSYENRKVR